MLRSSDDGDILRASPKSPKIQNTDMAELKTKLRPDEMEGLKNGHFIEVTIASPCEDKKYETLIIEPPD